MITRDQSPTIRREKVDSWNQLNPDCFVGHTLVRHTIGPVDPSAAELHQEEIFVLVSTWVLGEVT
jgi:hypothetical protein